MIGSSLEGSGLSPPPGPEPVIEVFDVHKAFGANKVLKGVSLTVHAGEVFLVAGRSGSGKSTLLRCINHLEKIDAGRIHACGHLVGYKETNGNLVELPESQVARQRRDLGMVFQQFNLFPHLSVIDNIIAAPVNVLKVDRESARHQARELLGLVGLPESRSGKLLSRMNRM